MDGKYFKLKWLIENNLTYVIDRKYLNLSDGLKIL